MKVIWIFYLIGFKRRLTIVSEAAELMKGMNEWKWERIVAERDVKY